MPQSIGPAVPSFGKVSPTCGVQMPSCGMQSPSCGLQVMPSVNLQIASCGMQAPPCGVQMPSCEVKVPSCGIQSTLSNIQVPPCMQAPMVNNIAPTLIPNQPCGQCSSAPCGLQVLSVSSPCGVQVPPCGVQVPPCGVQVSPCGVQVPPCGVQVPPCGVQAPIINNMAPAIIPSQPCGQRPSFIPNQCGQCSSFGQTLAPIVPTFDCAQNPCTTLIDNTLANSLANALQLLIVSNLLESTLTTPCSNPYSSICETPNNLYSNAYEIVTPDYYPCNQIVTCEPVYEPHVEIPCYQELVYPCLEVSSIPSFDNCGLNYANSFGCSDNCGLVNPFASCGCLNSVFSPTAAEVLFPAEIPAQLTCNFGYMTSNVPCVNVNVEALPFNTCSCNNGLFY